MLGYCPQCDKREGISKAAGLVQQWSEPKPVCEYMPPGIEVPMVIMGSVCGHTISVRSYTEHNQAVLAPA